MRTNMVNCFGSDQIKSVQNGSNLIKLDQIWISHRSKNVNLKRCHIYHEKTWSTFFGSNQIKSVQNGSKWIKFEFLTYQNMSL